jgi:hypothetical protein
MITNARLSLQGGKIGPKPFEFPEPATAQDFQMRLFSQAGRDYWKAETGQNDYEYSGIFACLNKEVRFCFLCMFP